MKAGRNQQVILRLLDALGERDKDRVQSFFSDQSIFQTLRGGAVSGQESIWEAITAAKSGADEFDWEIERLDEDDCGRVLTEGKVRYLKNGNWREYPVRGRFEVRGSKILHWA